MYGLLNHLQISRNVMEITTKYFIIHLKNKFILLHNHINMKPKM